MAILLRNMLFKEVCLLAGRQRNRVPGYHMPTATMNGRSFRLFYPGEVSRASLRERSMIRFVTRNNCGFIKALKLSCQSRMIHNALHSEDL